tara:strand:- start:245 stop:466 length:222 start_codon:yes stop_codon:yes gene_type:complete
MPNRMEKYYLPLGHNYIVLKNGAAAQLNGMDVNVLQVALDHMIEHIEDVQKDDPQLMSSDMLESAEFIKGLLG